MAGNTTHIPVIIIGGGPVGLFLGILLSRANIPFKIFEKRAQTVSHSRSIGIHPVSLDLFKEAGIDEKFNSKGVKITQGLAYASTDYIGRVDFSGLPLPHNFILSIPQYQTEQILVQCLHSTSPGSLVRNTTFLSFSTGKDYYKVHLNRQNQTVKYTCDYLVGCDGKNSRVRKEARIAFTGQPYPDTYIMSDMKDTTRLGNNAAVFLHCEGVIESFPLPEKRRRWVVKTDDYVKEPTRAILDKLIQSRVDIDLTGAQHYMLGSFGVQHYMAATFAQKKVLLAGDAAHVVSPIGGQGMNLGWLGARELTMCLSNIYHDKQKPADMLFRYDKTLRQIAVKTARRAAFNMQMGRSCKYPLIRRLLLQAILNTPLEHVARKIFTMQHLKYWPV